ncbi:MAG: SdiA-regulated domain-containing protein [Planctomycetota bacterium]
MPHLRLALCLPAILLAAFALPVCAQSPFPGSFVTNIGGALPTTYETSGAVWHPRLQQYFIVSDSGIVTKMQASGTITQNWNYAGDLEGITVADADTDFIYLGNENPDSIIEFNIVTGAATRVFNLTVQMTGPVNEGLEALTFVPDPLHPEGGLFYAGHQGEGSVYVFSLPIKTSATSTTVTYITKYTPWPGHTDLAGLSYDPSTGSIFGVYDTDNVIIKFSKTGVLESSWVLPGIDQEGVAIRGCELLITHDTSKQVYKYRSFPDTAACESIWVDTNVLSISSPGTANFSLQSPPTFSGDYYFILGSASGTVPGFDIGAVHLPLNYDWYFDTIGGIPNGTIFIDTFGTLSATSGGAAQLVLPAGVPPTLVGSELYHSYLILENPTFNIIGASGTALVTLIL